MIFMRCGLLFNNSCFNWMTIKWLNVYPFQKGRRPNTSNLVILLPKSLKESGLKKWLNLPFLIESIFVSLEKTFHPLKKFWNRNWKNMSIFIKSIVQPVMLCCSPIKNSDTLLLPILTFFFLILLLKSMLLRIELLSLKCLRRTIFLTKSRCHFPIRSRPV